MKPNEKRKLSEVNKDTHAISKKVLKDRNNKRKNQLAKQSERREDRVAKYEFGSGMAVASDMNQRFIAAFLVLIFAISCMVTGLNIATRADEPVAYLTPDPVANKGLVNSKYLTINDSGNYDLTLETYATGAKITEQTPTDFVFVIDQSASMGTNSDIPTGGYSIYDKANRNYYLPGPNDTMPERYILGEDGNYYRVYAKKGYMYEYHPSDTYNGSTIVDVDSYKWFANETTSYDDPTAYYFNDGTGFYPMQINLRGKLLRYELRFYYRGSDGQSHQISREDYPIDQYDSFLPLITGNPIKKGSNWFNLATTGMNAIFSNYSDAWTYGEINALVYKFRASMYISFETYHRHLGYNQLCYRDANGVEHVLIDATYCDSNGYALGGGMVDGIGGKAEGKTSTNSAYWTGTLYTANGHITRLEALQNSLSSFVDSIATQKDSNGPVDHRIAIVGFSGGRDTTYRNTELLTGTNLTITDETPISSSSSTFVSLDGLAHNGVQKYDATQSDYDTALLQTKEEDQKAKIDKAVKSITAYGGTQPQDGLEMATEILKSRTTAGDYDDGKRNSVVIFFTDGRPGDYEHSDQYDAANLVVAQAAAVKATNNGKTDVYSIGVFGESDGNPLTYTVSMTSTDAAKAAYRQDYLDYTSNRAYFKMWFNNNDNYTGIENDTIADYMSVVSSNYPNAQKFMNLSYEQLGTSSEPQSGYSSTLASSSYRGTQNSTDYYRMATDQDALTNAFNKIFENTSKNKSDVELDATHSLVRDVFSDNFNYSIPTDASGNVTDNVTIMTYPCTSFDNDGTPVFSKTGTSLSPATVTYDTSKKALDVKGYDFAQYYNLKGETSAEDHLGSKLVITIHNLTPNKTGNVLESNNVTSGVYELTDDDGTTIETLLNQFPQPSVSRHSYTLNVGEENFNGKFDIVSSIVDSSGAVVSKDNAALVDVIVVDPSGNRTLYKNSGGTSVAQSGDRDVFYYENIPAGYQVKTEVKSTDETYTYTWTDNDDATLNQTTAQAKNYSYEDSNIYITSEANSRQAIVTMKTQGVKDQPDYSDKTKQFPVTLSLAKDAIAFAEESIADATITRRDGSTETVTLLFSSGVCTKYKDGSNVERDLTLASGEQVAFDAPAGYTLTATETPDDRYELSYTNSDSGTTNSIPVNDEPNTINIINTLIENPNIDSGILDNGNPLSLVMYVMAGVLAGAAAGTGVYGWRKKKKMN